MEISPVVIGVELLSYHSLENLAIPNLAVFSSLRSPDEVELEQVLQYHHQSVSGSP